MNGTTKHMQTIAAIVSDRFRETAHIRAKYSTYTGYRAMIALEVARPPYQRALTDLAGAERAFRVASHYRYG